MPREDTQFNSKTGSIAGKKSKRKPFDQRLRERLEAEMANGVTYEEALFKAMVKAGLKGSVQAFNALNDRAYGKAKQPIQLSGSLEHDVVESPLMKFNEIQKKIDALEKKQKRGKK